MAAVSLKRIGQFRFTFVRGSFGIQVSPVGSYAESRRPTWASWKDSMRPIHVGSFRQQKTEEIDVEKLVNADQTARLLLTEKTVNKSHPSRFGFMFDIDGVLVRGRRAIPRATVAMKKVLQLGIPTIFLTNGGCETEEHKAKVLSTQLHHKIYPDQIVLSHSPLRKLDILHDKHVVVSGQGPVAEIAAECGFKNVSTLEDISHACPILDVNDRKKRFHVPPSRCHDMKRTDGILLMGEPIHWETHLQILIDLLITNGLPNESLKHLPAQNIPIIAVNPDLLWMSEASNPRFGNGAFLCCLEGLYKKLTGKELVYTSVLGKPNLFTYKYAAETLIDQAIKIHSNMAKLERIYAIGDNLDTDIYGANTYKSHLVNSIKEIKACKEDEFCTRKWKSNSLDKIESVLVRTGVSSIETSLPQKGINHLHRDTKYHPELTMPDYIVDDVLDAVDLVLHKEQT